MSGAENFQVSVIWPDVDQLPILRANQFLGQLGPGPDGMPEDFILTIGFLAPPVLLGSPQEQQASLGALGAVSVRALTRVSMSRVRLGEMIELLQRQAATWDAVSAKSDPEGQGGAQ